MPFNVFNPRSNDWRPIFLRTEADVRRLNRLFRSGWYLIEFDLPDLPSFTFYVPTEELRPLRTRHSAVAGEEPVPPGTGQTVMVILRRGRGEHEQRAFTFRLGADGYIDLSLISERLREEGEGWGGMGR